MDGWMGVMNGWMDGGDGWMDGWMGCVSDEGDVEGL